MQSFFRFFKKWRPVITQFFTLAVFAFMLWWLTQNYWRVLEVFRSVGWLQGIIFLFLFTVAYLFSVGGFVTLVHSSGYTYSFAEGYHALNLAQLVAWIPGGVWGFLTLGGALWARGVTKADSALIVLLNTAFGLCAGVLLSAFAVGIVINPEFAWICLLPILGWVFGRNVLEKARQRFFSNSSCLPFVRDGLFVLGLHLIAWGVEAAGFVWLLRIMYGELVSPVFAASAYAAAYFVGFVVPLAPGGLGVREGVLVMLLGGMVSAEGILAVAVSFRLLQTLGQWLNILVTVIARLFGPIGVAK